MGRGNPCVFGKFEGLFLVDMGDLDCYYPKDMDFEDDDFVIKTGNEISYEEMDEWEYDELYSEMMRDDFFEYLQTSFCERFAGFTVSNKWIDRDNYAILENRLFYVVIEFADTMLAVKLLQKEGVWDDSLSGLQKRHYKTYLSFLKKTLLEQFETIYLRNGAWMVSAIHREEQKVS